MDKLILYVALKRLTELLGSCLILSAIISFLCICNILPDGSLDLVIGLYIAMVLFVFINVKMMRRCYFELRNTTWYFIANYGAYFIFGLLTICAYKFFSAEVYTCMFAITKFARYTNLHLTTSWSTVVFHAIMGIAIFLAPTGMNWVYQMEEENFVSEEMIPPALEIILTENDANSTEVLANENKEKEEKNPLP